MSLINIEIYEDKLGGTPKFRIKLPAVPRLGETITLEDGHYVVDDVYWQANTPVMDPPPGRVWLDHTYYAIRLVVGKLYKEKE